MDGRFGDIGRLIYMYLSYVLGTRENNESSTYA